MDRKTDYCRKQRILLLGTWKLDQKGSAVGQISIFSTEESPGKVWSCRVSWGILWYKIAGTSRYTAFLIAVYHGLSMPMTDPYVCQKNGNIYHQEIPQSCVRINLPYMDPSWDVSELQNPKEWRKPCNHRGCTDFLWKLWSSGALCSSMYPCFLLQVHQGSSLRILPLWTLQLQSETLHVRTAALREPRRGKGVVPGAFCPQR